MLMVPTANAAETEYPYESSEWAQEYIKKALALGITHRPYGGDLRLPIERGDFAEKAASLVAIEFGSNLECYRDIMCYRGQVANGEPLYLTALDVAKNLGIIQGRGDGNWDEYSSITRQEAAVMLARTYRAYGGKVPKTLTALTFTDRDDIADWAMADVQLMNHLGIMTGIEDNRFDPMGSYTSEQCLVTLLRLHEKAPYDGSLQENPFFIPVIKGGLVKNWDNGSLAFAIETEKYYIFSCISGSALGVLYYKIDIIDQDLCRRSYHPVIVTGSNMRGRQEARPENAYISEDGTKLIYTATVKKDVYYNGLEDQNPPVQLKGIYTVTMDLKTGEQTYTRTNLKES